MEKAPLKALRHHVTGAIQRGEKQAIIEQKYLPFTYEQVTNPDNINDNHYVVKSGHGNFVAMTYSSHTAKQIVRMNEIENALKAAINDLSLAAGSVKFFGNRAESNEIMQHVELYKKALGI